MDEGPTHRLCSKCRERKLLQFFRLRKSVSTGRHYYGTVCKACQQVTSNQWRRENSEVVKISAKRSRVKHKVAYNKAALEYHFKKKYGLTMAERNKMLQLQGGCCAICLTRDPRGKGWCIDHDHVTGKVRSILCAPCNLVIGHALESVKTLRAAADYLEKFNGVST